MATAWQKFEHRAPIDGLRAIAALLVVVFHAKLPGFDNGYIGVDVFFVLSGYLITSLITREHLTKGRISLLQFYSRRAKRLFPAALTVLLITAVIYQLIAPPFDVLENRPGFAYAAIYVSNWYFLARSQNYFAADSSPSPVLHYWSLSVEEQFYLVWPIIALLVFLIPQVRKHIGPYVLGAFAIGALVLSGLIARDNVMLAYFGTIGRAYQLLIGATLATAVLWWQRSRCTKAAEAKAKTLPKLTIRQRSVGAILIPLGVAGLIYSATNLGPSSPWWTGIVGTFATVSILLGIELAPTGLIPSALSSPPARYLGRWSYSIYLWHWPLIVLLGIAGLLPEMWYFRVPLIVAGSIALAAATWYLIEGRALRIPAVTYPRMRTIIAAGVGATVAAAVSVLIVLQVPVATSQLYAQVTQTTPQGGSAADGTSAVNTGDDTADGTAVYDPNAGTDPSPSASASGAPTKHPTVLLVGDSHAQFWIPALEKFSKDNGIRLVTVTRSACPWLDVTAVDDHSTSDILPCDNLLRQPALDAAAQYKPDITILVSRSILVRTLVTDSGRINPGDPGWAATVDAGVSGFLKQLTPLSKSVVLFEPVPETTGRGPVCLSKGGPPSDCDLPGKHITGTDDLLVAFHKAATAPGVVSINLDNLVCPNGICPAMVDNVVTHRDEHHLTTQYASLLMPALDTLLKSDGVDLVTGAVTQ